MAAGVRSRLRSLTDDRPKSLIEVDGQSMLRHRIQLMIEHGINDIAVVVGYRKEMIMEDGRENVLLVEKKEYGAEEMKVQVKDGRLVASSKEIPREESFGEWTGLA